ncbi:MAG TPA: carotenoid biosynthesis protein [Ferruginibacter sp.]|nr:carotenoid biosynthesis protein [Ferruginibacter sp.]
MKNNFSKYQVATAIAILFHAIGLIGILFFDRSFFIQSTAMNLLLMFGLLIYTQDSPRYHFWLFMVLCIVVGIGIEIIGTQTGYLFGDYRYGTVLGPSVAAVPLIIGVNWFIIIYCSGISIHTILSGMIDRLQAHSGGPKQLLKTISIVIDGATLAVFFDWLMEPVAVKLGYWTWLANGEIPFYNYVCWFVVSVLLLLLFQKLPFPKKNKFAVHLFLIQIMFFLILRTLL